MGRCTGSATENRGLNRQRGKGAVHSNVQALWLPALHPANGCTKRGTRPVNVFSTAQEISRPCKCYSGTSRLQTTGDIYTDWDIDHLSRTLLEAVDEA